MIVLSIFWKSVEKVKGSLKSDKNNGCFISRRLYIFDILLNFILEWEMFQNKNCRENENTYYAP